MTTLSIKDVPDDWAEALRQRAARNHRSLQGELTAILEAAVLADSESQGVASRVGASAHAAQSHPSRPVLRRGTKTIEQIYAEHLERFPQPFTEGPMSVDIIRRDRDSR